MPINDPTKVQFYTGFNTFKNYDQVVNSIVIPATSYAAGTFKQYTMTLPLESTLASTQVLHNISTAGFSDRYYLGNAILQIDLAPTSNFSTQIRTSYTATDATVDVFVINQTGGTVNSTEFTVTTYIKRFITPFD